MRPPKRRVVTREPRQAPQNSAFGTPPATQLQQRVLLPAASRIGRVNRRMNLPVESGRRRFVGDACGCRAAIARSAELAPVRRKAEILSAERVSGDVASGVQPFAVGGGLDRALADQALELPRVRAVAKYSNSRYDSCLKSLQ